MSVLRLIYLIIAGSLGGYGISLLSTYILAYLCSTENFGVPILAPYAPLNLSDGKDGVYMYFLTNMKKRPEVLKSKNKTRLDFKEINK
jgi:hypothetical protein